MSQPFDPRHGLIVVPARLWGPNGHTTARLALDTGAVCTMVNWDILVMLGYDPAIVDDRVQMTTGSGVEHAPRVAVQRVEALDLARQNLRLLCHTLPASASVDGVLGLDFLRGQRLTIDFRQGLVTLD